jgi:putative hydrolase
MDDANIFDQLFKLLNQPGSINWALAEQIAGHMTGAREPIDPWLADEYLELTRLAQLRIADHSGLLAGPLFDTVPLDRAEWATRNLKSFSYLVEPMADKLAAAPNIGGMEAMLRPLGPALMGMQMGAMVGTLSQRVLGQFDIGLPVAEHGDISYVVPNIEAFATDHDLDPRQVRLWVALHEVLHHIQFAQAWVRPHLNELIRRYVEAMDIDFGALTEKLSDFQDPSKMQDLLADGNGLQGLLSGDDGDNHAAELQAFMAVMEGYGDYVIDRAGADLLPQLARMKDAMRSRHAETAEGEHAIGQMLGMSFGPGDFGLGARFCDDVANRWGEDTLMRLWEGPQNLPTLEELGDPVGWAARVLLD